MNAAQKILDEMGFSPKTDRQPSEAVIYSLARTYSLIAQRLSGVYQRGGLTAASFNLLMLLQHGRDPDCFTQQAIGRRLVVSASDMTGLIDRLERKGLVKRLPGRDRRSKLLRITPKGTKLLEAVWPAHVEAIGDLARPLGQDESTGLLRALDRLRESLSA